MAEKKDNVGVAIVRLRGTIGLHRDIERTLTQLSLFKKNYCVIVPNTKSYMGMIQKIKDYVTWGNIDENVANALREKRASEFKGRTSDKKGKIKYKKFSDSNSKNIKKFFKLNSPRKGYGRKGIKMPFSKGGALGNRDDKIKDLILRML